MVRGGVKKVTGALCQCPTLASDYGGHVVHIFILWLAPRISPMVAMRPMDITREEAGGSCCGRNPLDVTMEED